MQTICQHRKPFKKAVQEKHKHFTQTHTQAGSKAGTQAGPSKAKLGRKERKGKRTKTAEHGSSSTVRQTANAEIGLLASRKQRKKPPSPPTTTTAAAIATTARDKSRIAYASSLGQSTDGYIP